MTQIVRAIRNVLTVNNVKDYGAAGNAQHVTDGAISSGTATLTSATSLFTAADVGKRITVVGAGAAGICLNTTILAYVSASQVTLNTNASTTVSGASTWWGTGDGTPIQSTETIAQASGGAVYFPPGSYISSTGFTITGSNVRVIAHGYSTTKLICASSTTPFITVDATGTGGIENITFEGFEVDCLNQSATAGILLKGGNHATSDYIKTVTFRNCYFRNAGGSSQGAVQILAGRGSTDRGLVTDVRFEDCIFDTATQYHFYATGGQIERLSFWRCKFINSSLGCIGFNQPAKSSLTGYNGVDSDGIRSNKNWSIIDCYFSNSNGTGSFINDANKTGVRGLQIVRNFFDAGYSGASIYAYCVDVEGGSWGVKIKDNIFWRAYKCISIGQSNNGPWFQTNPTFMSEVSGNVFFQAYQVFDHDSDCAANIHDNVFYETSTTAYNANYGRHWPARFRDNTIINCPTVSGTGSENAAMVVAPFGMEIRDNTIVENRVLADPTTAPTLSTVAGGSMGARTYYVKYTWENDTGETLASSEANIAVGANRLLKITHPYTSTYGPPAGAKRINWYVSTSAGTETKQDYTWLPWAQEYEVYPVTQQAVTWTEPTTGLIAGSALPGSNTTHAITAYGIYEVSGASMFYPNIYEGNNFLGLTSNEIYSSTSSYKRIQKMNWTTRDLTLNSTPQVLEAIPYALGNITGATTFDVWNGEYQTGTLTGNITTTISSGHYVGQRLRLVLTQDGTGGRTISKPANTHLSGGVFSPSAAAGAVDEWILEWDGTYWNEISRALNIS